MWMNGEWGIYFEVSPVFFLLTQLFFKIFENPKRGEEEEEGSSSFSSEEETFDGSPKEELVVKNEEYLLEGEPATGLWDEITDKGARILFYLIVCLFLLGVILLFAALFHDLDILSVFF